MILCCDLFFDRALQSIGKNAPGVGFDFEMLAGVGISNTPLQGFLDVGVRRTKRVGGFGIEWDVEMHTCLTEIAGLQVPGIDGFEEHRKIFETFEGAIGSTRDDLMKIGRFVELTDRFQRGGIGWVQAQGIGEMDFRQADVRIDRDGIERFLCVVELDCEVAAIVVQADALLDDGGAGGIAVESFEKCQGFRGVFKMTERFGFEPEVEVDLVFLGEILDEIGHFDEVFADEGFIGVKGFVGAWKGGDRSARAFRGDLGDDLEKVLGVKHSLLAGPIGLEDFFLHRSAVKRAVGESVDGENHAVIRGEPIFEMLQLIALKQLSRRACRKPQADGIRLVGRLVTGSQEPIPHRKDMLFKSMQSFQPGFGGVDVGAVA